MESLSLNREAFYIIEIITMAIHSDMQGPCPDGFHVPLSSEWLALYNAGISIGARTSSGGTNFSNYLKIPFNGARNRSSSNTESQGSYGWYWSSSCFDTYNAYCVNLGSTFIGIQGAYYRAYGFSVRPFKDKAVKPDNSWTTLYDGSSVASDAGIFHNSTLGLISISGDGTTWITIADKNLGATTVWNSGDTVSAANCGKYYQWGNNYGFPRTGDVTVSSTQVDASTYGPGNYYSSDTFIKYNGSWDSPANANLWGGSSQGTWGTPDYKLHGHIGTWHMEHIQYMDYSAMQGPCSNGFHVPLNTEWNSVYTIWTTLGGGASDSINFGISLKLPFAGYRDNSSSSIYGQGSELYYWSSERNSASRAYILAGNTSVFGPTNGVRTRGFSIRGFKDIPVTPTNSRTKLYGTSIEAGGIFRSSSLGLISLSSDGTTWITMADKNVGATTVWNSGDTPSEANCGKYYQWGNNYGFPRTGTVTTSSTQVDASNYGPGNYYSSDTFITYSGRWDTTDNGNLWGGVTGPVQVDKYVPRSST